MFSICAVQRLKAVLVVYKLYMNNKAETNLQQLPIAADTSPVRVAVAGLLLCAHRCAPSVTVPCTTPPLNHALPPLTAALWRPGRNCTDDLDECEVSHPCVHGICQNTVGSYQCYCRPGFLGDHCNLDYDECLSQPCLNNGTCENLVNGYDCQCAPGFTGEGRDICRAAVVLELTLR